MLYKFLAVSKTLRAKTSNEIYKETGCLLNCRKRRVIILDKDRSEEDAIEANETEIDTGYLT